MKISNRLSMAVILLSATFAMAAQSSAQNAAAPPKQTTAAAQQPSAQNAAAPAKQTAPSTKQTLVPKTQAEYDAYKAAAAQTDPAKMEAAATDFAQKFPDSDLRPFLFQQAMGMYQQADNQEKSLEMARVVLKYDPSNAVALLTAAQLLAERTTDNDLDKNERLAEAKTDAQSALQNAGSIAQPANMSPEQFAGAIAQLRGTAHEVLGTVAFKKLDYTTAINEYKAAAELEKEHTEAVVWLRLSIAYDKSNDFNSALDAAKKAIAASEPNSSVRKLAEQEKSRLDRLVPATVQPASK